MEVEEVQDKGDTNETCTKDKMEAKERNQAGKWTLALKLTEREMTREAGNHVFDIFLRQSLRDKRKFSLVRWGVKGGGLLFTTRCGRTYKLMEEVIEKGVQWRGSKVVKCKTDDLERKSMVAVWCSHCTMRFKDLVEILVIEHPALRAEEWTLWRESEPEEKGKEFSIKMRPHSVQGIRRNNGKFRLCGGVIRVVCKIL
ncbi:hypothetical protein WN55_00001 [Dufourea novaeangliae]|nr:hypothetical protein WN55_00001 [Dufourea novaeangliae]